jgi:hypothetical protein
MSKHLLTLQERELVCVLHTIPLLLLLPPLLPLLGAGRRIPCTPIRAWLSCDLTCGVRCCKLALLLAGLCKCPQHTAQLLRQQA